MKKVLSVLTVLVVVSMLFACSSGGSSDSDNAPVKVSFNVETPHEDIAKTATVNDPGKTFSYWYKAVPQWTGDDFATIQGATAGKQGAVDGYVEITNYVANKDIGLFAQGSWKFYAQVKCNGSVIYQSAAEPEITYINSSTHSVTLNVTRVANGTATVSIDIEVPDTSSTAVLIAGYSGDGTGTVTLQKNQSAATHGANWSRFTGTSSALTTGSYLFTLTSKTAANGVEVGGAVLAFDIIAGVNRTIEGTIENGTWQTTLITINEPTFSMSIEADDDAVTVAKNTDLEYTCTASKTNMDGTIAYQWYVGNTPVAQNGTSETYTFRQATPGYYYVTCKAYVNGKAVGSQTLPVTVTE